MEWTPIAFGTFKVLALGIGMYFAIKWHYDQGTTQNRGAILRTGGILAAFFVLMMITIGAITFVLSRKLGLDLSWP